MIHRFRDKYEWLRNFTEVKIIYCGLEYQYVENAYHSAKSEDIAFKNYLQTCTPVEAKHKAKTVNIRADWDDIKLKVMFDCLLLKFEQEPFKTLLLQTGNENIQEGNYHGDDYWGINLRVNPNVGENNLGRLIMKIRSYLRQKEKLRSSTGA